MKFSQFNAVVPYEDQFALYNSYTQSVLFMVPELEHILQMALGDDIDTLANYHPEFYTYLVTHDYIVSESIDEVDRVRVLSNDVDNNLEEFILTVNPTMNCNFSCWYCYETHIRKSHLTTDVIERLQRFIETTAAKPRLKRFSLSFFGGEPLLYFRHIVVPLTDHFVATCRSVGVTSPISFTTNGYLINPDCIRYFKNREIQPAFQITLDGSRDDHNSVRFSRPGVGSYDRIVDNIRLLIQNKFFVCIRVNFTDANIAQTHGIAESFSDLSDEERRDYLMFDFHRVWQNASEGDVSALARQNVGAIRALDFHVKDEYAPNNVLESCYADKRNSAVVNYNGDVFKCTARDFTPASREGYLNDAGEIVWENDGLERRMNAKFKNPPCLKCRILPLCNGGCSQHALEHDGTAYCVYGFDETQKDAIIRSRIDEIVAASSNSNVAPRSLSTV